MELVHLRTFLAVLEHRRFRCAARHLYLSQSAVSRHVAELERSVGVPLLDRVTGGIEPTPAGRVLAEHAQRLIDDDAEVVRRARRSAAPEELVLGVAPCGAGELTPVILRHLRTVLPTVRLSTYRLSMLDWPVAVPEGTDLMVSRDPFDDGRVRATVLLTERAQLAAPRRLLEERADLLRLEQVLELPYVRMSGRVPAPFARFWTLAEHRGGLSVDFRGPPATRPGDAPRGVARGYGVAIGTGLLARLYRCPPTSLAPFEHAPVVRTVLVSAIEDRRPIIDAVHREVAWVTRRFGPLVLPELAEPLPV